MRVNLGLFNFAPAPEDTSKLFAGDFVYMDEVPSHMGDMPHPVRGEVASVDFEKGEVVVNVGHFAVYFEIDGGLWSSCGEFKREPWGYKPPTAQDENEDAYSNPER